MAIIDKPAASAPATAGVDEIVIRCPADGRIAGTVPVTDAAGVAAVATRLRTAQPEWEALGPQGRARHLLTWLDWILDNETRILELVQSESGKSSGDTKIETMVATEVINYYAKNAAKFLAPRTVKAHNVAGKTKRLRLHYRPYELVGQIFPWNYPLGMPLMDVPPALMAGAVVLSKPSEVTPLAWTEVVRGFNEEIGAPPVLACVNGRGETGAAVVDVVDMIQFTGSTATGRRIAMRAAERLIPVGLELGGKDAMVVLADANIDRAVGGAVWGGLFNAGQSCIAVERIYVEEPAYDAFVEKLTEKVAALRTGMDEMDSFSSDVGALATEQQLAIVQGQVEDALAKGARVLTGGRRTGEGLIYEPTVLVDVDHTMTCMQEETFGPTLPVMRVKNEQEAIRLANDSPYGLNGSVWTADSAHGEQVATQLETGGVSVNNTMATIFQFPLPFGGWKTSGIGSRFGGADGLLKYCRRQSVTTERMNLGSEIHWYPYTQKRGKLQVRLVRLLGANDWRRRFGKKGRS